MQEGKQLGEQTVELARTQMPVSASDLNINGKELMAIMPRAQIRYILPYLLNRVQSGNLPNEKKALLQAARKHLNRARKCPCTQCYFSFHYFHTPFFFIGKSYDSNMKST